MNDYEKYLTYDMEVLDYSNYEVGDRYYDIIKNIIESYDKVSMEEWFEDKTIVEKSIPEFNFV